MNYKVENCEHTNGKSIAATTSVGVVTDPSEEIIGMTFPSLPLNTRVGFVVSFVSFSIV